MNVPKKEISIEGGGGSNKTTDYTQSLTFFQDRHKPVKELDFTENKVNLYLYSIDTEKELLFDLIPQQVATTYGARYQSISTYGSIRPVYFYTGGNTKQISFQVELNGQDIAAMKGYNRIYNLIDNLKAFSVAIKKRNKLGKQHIEGHEVYLQIGNHFAGKGYLKTGFVYNLPIIDEQYQHITVDFTFTYTEEFEQPISTITTMTSGTHDLSGLTLSSNLFKAYQVAYKMGTSQSYYTTNKYAYLKGFLENSESIGMTEYFIRTAFNEEKLNASLNTIRTNAKEATTDQLFAQYDVGYIHALQGMNSSKNAEYMVIYVEDRIKKMSHPDIQTSVRLTNLRALLKSIETFKDYINTQKTNRRLTTSQRDSLNKSGELLNNLKNIVQVYISLLENLKGATT